MKKVLGGVAAIAIAALAAAVVYAVKRDAWVIIPKAREPLLTYMKDPTSAQFRNERIAKSGVLCGEVNAKNSMGGYVGFKRYIAAGPEANYLEGAGPLGRPSTADIIKQLAEENSILQRFIKYRKDFPDLRPPSDSERAEMAAKSFFEFKWEELCNPSLSRSND